MNNGHAYLCLYASPVTPGLRASELLRKVSRVLNRSHEELCPPTLPLGPFLRRPKSSIRQSPQSPSSRSASFAVRLSEASSGAAEHFLLSTSSSSAAPCPPGPAPKDSLDFFLAFVILQTQQNPRPQIDFHLSGSLAITQSRFEDLSTTGLGSPQLYLLLSHHTERSIRKLAIT